ncbi:MAG: hypothetical protein JW785_11210 [Acidimicrobiia bacterium]|nr:hypothetical protein [Acidimicrobiia bacterium]
MAPQDERLRGGPPRWIPPTAALTLAAGLFALLWVFLPQGEQAPGTTTLWEGPFGPALDGALAYLGADRMLYLVDLRDGVRLGCKGVPNDRRPAAVSPTHAYLGRLSARPGEPNWDCWRALPWEGTAYVDVGPGDWIAYAPQWESAVAAMAPLPGGGNGVRLLGDEAGDLARSEGVWGALVPVGEGLLARELTGAGEAWWWLAPGAEPRPAALPAGFRPAAGGPGRVAGWAYGVAVVADLGAATLHPLAGPLSAAADWDADGRRLAVVTADPPRLTVYGEAGGRLWQSDLDPPVAALRFGVAWAPAGGFLVLAEGGTLAAYSADGARIGLLDPLQPQPEAAAAWIEVLPLPGPSS